jgi:hypothetical protein
MGIDNILKFFRSKTFVIIIITLFGLALLAGAFALGTFVGYKKAAFSYRWGENYHLNFGGPKMGFLRQMEDFGGGDFIEGHGTFGRIIKIDGSTLIIESRDKVEKVVLVKDDTEIQKLRNTLKIDDLKVGDYAVVIGEPNDLGQIEAKFIRVMPVSPRGGPVLPTSKLIPPSSSRWHLF